MWKLNFLNLGIYQIIKYVCYLYKRELQVKGQNVFTAKRGSYGSNRF